VAVRGIPGFDAEEKPKSVYYGLGWFVRTELPADGEKEISTLGEKSTQWHTGSLDGTSTILVRRHDGLCWAVLFNTRNSTAEKAPARLIDRLMHKTANAIQEWPEGDELGPGDDHFVPKLRLGTHVSKLRFECCSPIAILRLLNAFQHASPVGVTAPFYNVRLRRAAFGLPQQVFRGLKSLLALRRFRAARRRPRGSSAAHRATAASFPARHISIRQAGLHHLLQVIDRLVRTVGTGSSASPAAAVCKTASTFSGESPRRIPSLTSACRSLASIRPSEAAIVASTASDSSAWDWRRARPGRRGEAAKPAEPREPSACRVTFLYDQGPRFRGPSRTGRR